jgi:threonine synthase
MAAENLRCKECKTTYALDARYVCERCFGPLEVTYQHDTTRDVAEWRRRIQGGPQNIWRYADFLPLEQPPGPSLRASSKAGLPSGCTPLIKADRLAERLGLGEVWIKNDAANPTHSFKDRVVSVAIARARELGFEVVACASTGNLANSVAAHAAALGLESYVFIPADLEEQKILATGVYGTHLVAVNGNYDDVNRLCTELSGERDWAFVNVNMRPYYAEGSKTLAFEVAEQLGWELPDRCRRADRLGLAVHEDQPRLRGVARARPDRGRRPVMNGAQAVGCSPVAQAGRPARTSAARSSRTRSPSRWPSATPRTAPTRSTWPRPRRLIEAVSDDEIRAGIRLLAETTGIFTETGGRHDDRDAGQARRAGGDRPEERVVLVITGDGLKTLDAVRGSFETHVIEPTYSAFEREFAGVA